ncbi:hypothetical protein MLD38_012422 [Melastoma candidum]|uniref:Uncharacterized protein n=1 Tax=Melastoma candidum TaxID=119954 RepID=A0ACB9R6B1_9MYRT|nr:hypothetical protein MLD38_012422 [Melastoma candidum]
MLSEQGFVRSRADDSLHRVNQIRDKFEYDRERRMRDKAFAPMNSLAALDTQNQISQNKPFDAQRYSQGVKVTRDFRVGR